MIARGPDIKIHQISNPIYGWLRYVYEAFQTTFTFTNKVKILDTPEYADNAAAVAGGLAVGTVYRTGDALKIVH